jgi:endonuclease IV
MEYKNGVAITIEYIVLGRTTGLTDVTLKAYNSSDVLKNTITMTEVSGGLYRATFTPDSVGLWRVAITSVTNLDNIQKGYQIVAYTIADAGTDIAAVKGVVDTIAIDTTTIISDVGDVKGVVDTIALDTAAIVLKTANLPADTADVLSTINSKLDALINEGGYIL